MPAPVYLTINEFPGTGAAAPTTVDFNFAGGYISQEHVKAELFNPETYLRTPVPVTSAEFLTAARLALPVVVPVGHVLRVYRDTPKDAPLVDFSTGARLTEPNLDLTARQAVFVAAESADQLLILQVADVLAATEAAAGSAVAAQSAANASATSALGGAAAASAGAAAASSAAEVAVAAADAATAAADLAAASNALLSAELASPAGGSLVVLEDGRTLQEADDARVTVVMGGGGVDRTAAINAAILKCALRGGGVATVPMPTAGTYHAVVGTILLPSNVVLDLNGCTLRGTNAVGGAPMFQTAYVQGGTLVSNIGSAPETRLVFYAGVRNGQIQNVRRGMEFFNFTYGCQLSDLHFEQVEQPWMMSRCFYARYENITARGGSAAGVPAYWFYDNTNAVNLTRVSATMEFPFLFEAGVTATTLTNCTSEGGSKGIKFKGDVVGMTIDGHYFENMPLGGTALDFTEAGTCYINFKANYFNYVDVVLDDGGATGTCTLYGTWDESNQIMNAGVTLPETGYLYRGLMKVDGLRNHIRYNLREASGSAAPTIPANWQVSGLSDVSTIASFGGTTTNDIRAKTPFKGLGIIPAYRAGDIGAGFPNTVPFAQHSALVPGNPNVTVVVDTLIKWRPGMVFAKFCFIVADNVGTYRVYGDVYGDSVRQHDTTGKTVTINGNVLGDLQIRVSGFTHPTGTYSCTGNVQLCT